MKSIETSDLRVPLTGHDHQFALAFAAEQETPAKGKQVYLNTLAVIAVHKCLKWVGIETTSLESSDSWHPGRRAIFDVADLYIHDYGRIECRPVLPYQTHVTLPPEVTKNRGVCVAVQFYNHMNSVQVVGFKTFAEQMDFQATPINIKDFEAFEGIFDYISVGSKPIYVSDLLKNKDDFSKKMGWLNDEDPYVHQLLEMANMSRSIAKSSSKVIRHKVVEIIDSNIEYQILVSITITVIDKQTRRLMLQLSDLKSNVLSSKLLHLQYQNTNNQSESIDVEFKNQKYTKVFNQEKSEEMFKFNLILKDRVFAASFIL